MESSKLKLNKEKMVAMVLGSQSWTSITGTGHLEIGNSLISFQPNVKDLGVVLDWVLPYVITSAPSVAKHT